MLGRIVEIADDRRYLSVSRGFLMVQSAEGGREEIGRVPLDDIAAVIANAHGLSYTNNVLVALAERGVPFVLCSSNHCAVGMLLAVEGHHQQAKRYDAQASAAKPVRKRLWSDLVRMKLGQQAAVLTRVGAPSAPLSGLIQKVRSGDPDNVEAQGARRYWRLLFGDNFRRDQKAGDVNGLLNYGYTVLRAATARAVVAAGLHPTVGLHHGNEGNSMRLVDDLMEPFRPLVDLHVWHLRQKGVREVDANVKRLLAQALYQDVQTDAGVTPVISCIQRLTGSLVQVFLGERRSLDSSVVSLPLQISVELADD